MGFSDRLDNKWSQTRHFRLGGCVVEVTTEVEASSQTAQRPDVYGLGQRETQHDLWSPSDKPTAALKSLISPSICGSVKFGIPVYSITCKTEAAPLSLALLSTFLQPGQSQWAWSGKGTFFGWPAWCCPSWCPCASGRPDSEPPALWRATTLYVLKKKGLQAWLLKKTEIA